MVKRMKLDKFIVSTLDEPEQADIISQQAVKLRR